MNVISVPGLPDCHSVNVVCTFNLGVALNSTKLVLYHRRYFPVKFNDARFAAFTVKFIPDGGSEITAHAFGTGAVVLTGAYCAEDARLAAWNIVRFFNDTLGVPATVVGFTIRNIVSSFHLGFPVDLIQLKLDLGSRVSYTPDLFPAAIFQSATDTNVTSLLYRTGNGVLTGCKQPGQIRKNYINVYNIASMYDHRRAAGIALSEQNVTFERRQFREMQQKKLRQRAFGVLESQGKLASFIEQFAVNKKEAAANTPLIKIEPVSDDELQGPGVLDVVVAAATGKDLGGVDAAESPEQLARAVAEEEAASYRPSSFRGHGRGSRKAAGVPAPLFINVVAFTPPPVQQEPEEEESEVPLYSTIIELDPTVDI